MRKTNHNDIIEHFSKYANYNWPSNGCDYDSLMESIYFITLCPRKYSSDDIVLMKFRSFYIDMMKDILGRHIGSKVKYQPLTYAFIDYAGSREKRFVIPEARNEMPHIHALMSIHPITNDKMHSIISDPEFFMGYASRSFFSHPNIEKFNSEEASLEDLVSYCIKGSRFLKNNDAGGNPKFDIYPEREKYGQKRK